MEATFEGGQGLEGAVVPWRDGITGTELRYIRKCMRKTRINRIGNSQIRGILNQEPGTKMVEGHELRWFGNLIGMDSSRKRRQIWEMGVEEM
jgi:hypothetical protein